MGKTANGIYLSSIDAFALIRAEFSDLFETGQADFTCFSSLDPNILLIEFNIEIHKTKPGAGRISLLEIDQLLSMLLNHYTNSFLLSQDQLTDTYLNSILMRVRSVNIAQSAIKHASQKGRA